MLYTIEKLYQDIDDHIRWNEAHTKREADMQKEIDKRNDMLKRLEWSNQGFCPICHVNEHDEEHGLCCELKKLIGGGNGECRL
jgi:hypothetical protein